MNRKSSTLAVAVAIALGLPVAPAFAQSGAQTLDTVIVTGTRVADRTVAESQSPIDIITPEVLQATGSTELATALSRALPSLNFPRPALTDGTSGVRPAQLRGLSPDQVLILVNGKRRHLSGQLNVNGSMGRGSSAVDLNTIPVAAIERVEVLRDGASAQYGSDAIAGGVNIVLKGAGKGGSLALDLGQYSAGDGTQYQLSGDTGVSFADGRGTVHFAGQLSHQDRTNRAGPFNAYGLPGNPTPNTGNYPGVGVKAFVVGDPEVEPDAEHRQLPGRGREGVRGRRPGSGHPRRVGQCRLRLQRQPAWLRHGHRQQPRHHLVRVLPLAQPQRRDQAALPGRLRPGDQPVPQGPFAGRRPEGQQRRRAQLGRKLQLRLQPHRFRHRQHDELRAGRHQPHPLP